MFKRKKLKKVSQKGRISRKKELIKGLFLIILIAVALRLLVVYPLKISDDSMQGALFSGDFLMASSISYKINSPKPGDLVIFEHPFRAGEIMARRIVATEGQTVEIVGKIVYIDGEPAADYLTVQHVDYRILPRDFSGRDYFAPLQVPSGYIYVLGDNRDNCEDSRDFGCIDIQTVRGKGMFVYFSWAPDPNAPRMESPYIIPAVQIVFYNLFHFPSRVRWNRFFAS